MDIFAGVLVNSIKLSTAGGNTYHSLVEDFPRVSPDRSQTLASLEALLELAFKARRYPMQCDKMRGYTPTMNGICQPYTNLRILIDIYQHLKFHPVYNSLEVGETLRLYCRKMFQQMELSQMTRIRLEAGRYDQQNLLNDFDCWIHMGTFPPCHGESPGTGTSDSSSERDTSSSHQDRLSDRHSGSLSGLSWDSYWTGTQHWG